MTDSQKDRRTLLEENFRKFKVANKSLFVSTDIQTDGRMGENNLSPELSGWGGGRHNSPVSDDL